MSDTQKTPRDIPTTPDEYAQNTLQEFTGKINGAFTEQGYSLSNPNLEIFGKNPEGNTIYVLGTVEITLPSGQTTKLLLTLGTEHGSVDQLAGEMGTAEEELINDKHLTISIADLSSMKFMPRQVNFSSFRNALNIFKDGKLDYQVIIVSNERMAKLLGAFLDDGTTEHNWFSARIANATKSLIKSLTGIDVMSKIILVKSPEEAVKVLTAIMERQEQEA